MDCLCLRFILKSKQELRYLFQCDFLFCGTLTKRILNKKQQKKREESEKQRKNMRNIFSLLWYCLLAAQFCLLLCGEY